MSEICQIRHHAIAAPPRTVRLARPDYDVDRRPDGTILIRSRQQLGAYPPRLTDRLVYWAQEAPDRIFFAARDPAQAGGWHGITYAEALTLARRIGQALLQRELSPERPVVILSGNCLDHAMLALACLYVGIPHAPVSPAYSLVSTDFANLRHVMKLLTPGLVFAADGAAFAGAIEAAIPRETEIVVSHHPMRGRPVTMFARLSGTVPSAAVDIAHDNICPDTIAKFLFTSGSTGEPKAVINTQRMWCSNQEMLRTALPFMTDEPPVVVEWAPWHHTAGGNHEIGLVLYNGGTFYIDEGKPLPGAIAATVRNLREIAPTWYFNVPKGFEALLPHLRNDAQLRGNFFSRLKVLWFAGAGIAQRAFDEMQELALQSCGERILFLTGFGSTETAPYALARTWETDKAANIGLPGVGIDLKLVPLEDKLEARVRGPNVTPGYWRRPDLSGTAFDEEGFYRLGDAFRLDDPQDLSKGLLFDGRIAEDFKLATGTWVRVGPLRAHLIEHCAPLVRDVVIAGADRDCITALICPDIDACRDIAGASANASAAEVLAGPSVKRIFAQLLVSLAGKSTGSSNRIARAVLLIEPLSLDIGELTDKGSVNQRTVLKHRAALVEELYAAEPTERVITIEEKA